MAHLNVRERRLEAKIAYLGPELSGKATNFVQLGGRPVSGKAALAIDWTPASPALFRDYEVTVKLVAARGAPSAESVRDALHGADGIVFIADADPAAHERNRATLDIVREVLASTPPRNLPVVVQVNKADLPDALAADAVVSALDAGTWPHVSASATRGDGVVETIERALASVLEALRASDAEGVDPLPSNAPPSPTTIRPEGNPLLSALRRVLRDTVTEHVTEIEARTNANMERLLGAFFERAGVPSTGGTSAADADATAALQKTLLEDNARLREAVDALRGRVDELTTSISSSSASVATNTHQIGASLGRQSEVLASLEATMKSLPEAHERLREEIRGDMLATLDVGTAAAHERLREEIRSDMARTLESRARTEREHFASSTMLIKRSVDAIAADIKAQDSRATLTALRTSLGGMTEETARLSKGMESTVAALRTIEPRVGQAEIAMQREVRDGLKRLASKVEDNIGLLQVEATEANATAGQASQMLTELLEELKKPKKGWFG